MNIVIASDSFKGSLTSIEVADAIASGIFEVVPDANVTKIPMADGGEGTLDAVHMAVGGNYVNIIVRDGFGNPTESRYLILPDQKTVVLELADSSGLSKVSNDMLNPSIANTYGLGETIKHALDQGFRRFIIGIGGSSSNDLGLGMCHALGMRLFDKNGINLQPIGKNLLNIAKIDINDYDQRIKESNFLIACDVNNPLLGPKGAAHVFARQKGAGQDMINFLEEGAKHYSHLVTEMTGIDATELNGTGAAGGLGYALKVWFDAKIKSGAETLIRMTKLEEHIKQSDLVFTGEGRIDEQTLYGKVIANISKLAKKHNVPVIAICGSVEGNVDSLYELGIKAIYPIKTNDISIEEAMDPSIAKKQIFGIVMNAIKR